MKDKRLGRVLGPCDKWPVNNENSIHGWSNLGIEPLVQKSLLTSKLIDFGLGTIPKVLKFT